MNIRKLTLPVFGVALFGCAVFSSCEKENSNEGITILAEKYANNTKMAVNGSTLTWVSGDMIRIGSRTASVQIDGETGRAYIQSQNEDVPYEAPFLCVSPSSLTNGNPITDANVTVTLPRIYQYSESGGIQNLQVPMAAYSATANNPLTFKHITGALTVRVENSFGFDITVDSIVIASNLYQLSGEKDIVIEDDLSVAANNIGSGADNSKKVAMMFGTTALNIPCGEARYVQIPVLPVGAGNQFTVLVQIHSLVDAGEGVYRYTFEKTQNTGGSLLRAQLGYAPASFGGRFSIAGNIKVYFAPGNLQYQASTGTWRFASRQYTALGSNSAYGNRTTIENGRATQDKWIDLFGWAASGWAGNAEVSWTNYQPWAVDGTDAAYGPGWATGSIYETTNDRNEGDWAWHNAILNGGNSTHLWRTLKNGEWNYLLNTRTSSFTRYARGKVDGKEGIFIFCDNYVHPLPTAIDAGGSYSDNSVSYAECKKMEVAGAVFLPAAGSRGDGALAIASGGYYWSTVYSSANGAKCLYFTESTINYDNARLRHYGCAIRPVRVAN